MAKINAGVLGLELILLSWGLEDETKIIHFGLNSGVASELALDCWKFYCEVHDEINNGLIDKSDKGKLEFARSALQGLKNFAKLYAEKNNFNLYKE